MFFTLTDRALLILASLLRDHVFCVPGIVSILIIVPGIKFPFTLTCMYGQAYSKGVDQPGKVANPARGQLNREN